jgi:pimeloyl-ACP methyl ester carboxylesterase
MKFSIKIAAFSLFMAYSSLFSPLFAQQTKPKLYLIAGQGADYRLFQKYNFDDFDTTALNYIVPERGDNMASYARRLIAQMDTTQPFYLMGASLGGMLACEIAKVTHPEKVLIVASAKCRDELPLRFRFQKYIPLYKLFKGTTLKRFALAAQPIVEPESRLERPTFKAMLEAKHPDFMSRSIEMIVNWDNVVIPDNVVHIHGTDDHVIPLRRVKNAIVVEHGSHMMTLTRSAEVQPYVNQLLK